MSLWAKAQQLPPEAMQKVRSVYGDHFPIEVRHFLSQWIEEKMWTDMEPDNPQHQLYIANLIESLIVEMETRANTIDDSTHFLTKLKLNEAAKAFRSKYSAHPMMLFKIIRHCLATELNLVSQYEHLGGTFINMPANVCMMSDSITEINQELELLRHRTSETADDLRRMESDQENFALIYHDCTKLNVQLQTVITQPPSAHTAELESKIRRKKEPLEQQLNVKVSSLLQSRLNLVDKLKDTITKLGVLQSKVLDNELIKWKRDQQLAGNGHTMTCNLDNVQEWCESLAELIWANRFQVKETDRLKQKLSLDPPGVQDHLPNLINQVTRLLSSLVTSTFIIEKQPPQVMKTNTRFTSTVRLLVGSKLSVHMTPPQVKVSIISEAQAGTLLKNGNETMSIKNEASGEILNNTGTMEYHQATRQLSVSFRNMQLKKIKRAEKKGTESVMDEKFSLLFQSKFTIGSGELVFQVWTLSLPVVVIVHGNQEPHAWATVTWDNAFAEPGRGPFIVPEKVPWCHVAEALNTKFRSATGRALTDENLRFLADKAFRSNGNIAPGQDYSNLLLNWAAFCKEPLPERNFTFWEWFYAVMKLTREHLRGPWNDGLILGFIRKKQAEEMLANCGAGTFLMRFSDSELGGVTIAWVGDQNEVVMLQPFTSKDFAIRSLADRISDLQHLLYLYPDISKDHAFSKYYTPFQENQPVTGGYVKPLLVTHVPGYPGMGGQTPTHSSIVGVGGGPGGPGGSYPGTPSNMFQAHSPDSSVTRDTPSVASSYAPGLGQSVRTNADMDYVELMNQSDLPAMDENLNLDQFGNFGNFSELMQAYNAKQQ